MPRSGRLRSYIREFSESPRIEKLSVIPPFLVLAVEIILLQHAISINVAYVIELTLILLFLSIIEIILVTQELHENYMRTNFDRILTIRLDDFITQAKDKNVKKIVEDFIETHPKYGSYRNEIYHITCQIMETHKEEVWEKVLSDKLETFIKIRKKMNVDETLETFIKKYPSYKKDRDEVYQKVCQILDRAGKKK
jgi:hypothetical protein